MKKSILHSAFLMVLGVYFIHMPTSISYAQWPQVQVNLDVLDEIEESRARTMTEPGILPPDVKLVPKPKVMPKQKPEHVPVPPRKPSAESVEGKQVAQEPSEAEGVEMIKSTDSVPVPRKRPVVSNVPRSYIAKARDTLSEERSKSISPSFARDKPAPVVRTGIKNPDELERELVNPTAREVLTSIEPVTREKIPAPKNANNTESKGPAVSNAVKTVRAPTQAKQVKDKTEDKETVPTAASKNIKETVSLGFLPGVSKLTDEIKTALKTDLVDLIKKGKDLRVEIQAFATPDKKDANSARHMSLARALEIRSFLIENKIDAEKIDIRPLGSDTKTKPLDRVDIIITGE